MAGDESAAYRHTVSRRLIYGVRTLGEAHL
jgi:hypothetical protein